ncbi:MAG: DUF4270 family protein [Lewinellaceae bacterium]|nr:DUF4270 family protein [Lewinellaceae bacterium]
MRLKMPVYAAFLFTAFALFLGCSKSSPFGADLLNDQIADYAYTDTFTLRCTMLREDSVVSSDRSSTASFFLCGQLNDPLFGKSQSEIYSQLQFSFPNPDFDNAVLDSVVLYLRYNANGFYGDSTQPMSLRVFRTTDTLQWDRNYYTNSTLGYANEIGSKLDFMPRPRTAYSQFDTSATASKAAYIGIPLSQDFGNELLTVDSVRMTEDSLFWHQLRGIRIAAESNSTPGAMMAFDLNNESFSFVRLYFSKDTVRYGYDYYFRGANKFTHFSHDYTGAMVEDALGKEADEYLFLQGMTGVQVKVEIPYIDQLKDIVVNKAELELTAASVPGDDPLLSPANQLIFTELRGDTNYVISTDVLYSLGSTLTGGFTQFGGFPQTQMDNGQSVQRYRLTLSQRLQAMIDESAGDIKQKTIYLNVYPQGTSPMRAVLYGPKNSSFPAKLTLKYTRLQ